jgi:D-alanine transaminase
VHHFPVIAEPTVYAFAFPFPSFTRMLEEGIRAVAAEDIRWLRCDIKSVALLPNTMLYQQAMEQGAGECILIRDGKVTEATHSSVLGVMKGVLVTHPVSRLILPGITRNVVLEICREKGISFREVIPVIQVDDRIIGDGKPGPLTRFLQQQFFEKVKIECRQ